MITRSRLIAGASGIAGEPPDEPLPTGVPHWLRYETAADLETELMRDINLSAENRTMASYTVRLGNGQREFTVSQPRLENAAFVSLSYPDQPNRQPIDVEIGNVALIGDDERRGKRTVSFYDDKPQRAILSWSPGDNEELRIWYDRTPNTDPSAEQSTFTIADAYVPLLKLLLAATMLEMMNKPLGELLKARITSGREQWKKFVKNSRQQGIVQKTPHYTPRGARRAVSPDGDFRIPFE